MTLKASNRGHRIDFEIVQGKTFDKTLIWRNVPTIKRGIIHITNANPGVVTCPGHGFTTGQKRYISGVKVMFEVNDAAYTVTVIDPDTFSIGVDTTSYGEYLAGGKADNGLPVDLTNWTGRMQIRPSHSSSAMSLELTTANGLLILGGEAGTIRILISDTDTAALAIAKGVHDLELIAPDATVKEAWYGEVTVPREATR